MRRDNPVNKTQLVLTLRSCSKLEFNASEVALGKVEGRKSLSLSAAGRENVVTFHLPLGCTRRRSSWTANTSPVSPLMISFPGVSRHH